MRTPFLLLLAAGALVACGDDDPDAAASDDTDALPTVTTDAGATTTTLGFCTDLADFYEANGAFFLTVSSGEATSADLDSMAAVAAELPSDAPVAIAGDVELVAATIGELVTALRGVELTDTAAITAILIESTGDAAVGAADRMDSYAREDCGIDPEDAATPG